MKDLIWIIFAHFVGDWALQNSFVSQNKGKYWFVMLSHCMVWTAVISVALQYLGIFALWKVIFLIIGHWVMDKWKMNRIESDCSLSMEEAKHNLRLLYIDQTWHIAQCFIVFFIK